MKRHRRAFLYLAASAAALPAISQMAAAQAYPTRPITLIVPFGAGGPTDVAARIVADHMSRTLGRSLIVENVPGAGGTTATTRTMRATPDGYTVQIGHVGTHATAPLFYPNLAYKPDADFAPIGMVSQNTFLIGANKTLPPTELNEFIAYLRVNHQKMNMGHAGVGSVTHLTGTLFNGILGLKPALVPFNSAAAAMNALVAGHVDYMSAPVAEAAQHVRGGTIKAFAVASSERSRAVPDVPTSREAGLPEYQVLTWNGLFAPKGTPGPVLDRLTDSLDQALDDETTRKRLFDLGADVPPKERRGQQQLVALVKSEMARWASVIRAATQ